MKQIVMVSGKGGTGKTTVAAGLAELFESQIMSDCDVDAANLHLLFDYNVNETNEYEGGKKAEVREELCHGCGVCQNVCRFDALYRKSNGKYVVDEYACEGCNACVLKCPTDAIFLQESVAGEYYVSSEKNRPFVHAELRPGEENSGGLVAEVRKKSVDELKRLNKEYIIIDGAPGIGCPATSSIMGTQYAVIVIEPSLSGIHDLQRIVDTILKYRVRFGVVVNKFDINVELTEKIKSFCLENGYDFIAEIPMDHTVVNATIAGRSVIHEKDSPAARKIKEIKMFLEKTV